MVRRASPCTIWYMASLAHHRKAANHPEQVTSEARNASKDTNYANNQNKTT